MYNPFSLAEDHRVWNVTKDKITERVALVNEHSWNPPMVTPAVPVKAEDRVGYSPEIEGGRFNVDDVLMPIYEEAGRRWVESSSTRATSRNPAEEILPFASARGG